MANYMKLKKLLLNYKKRFENEKKYSIVIMSKGQNKLKGRY